MKILFSTTPVILRQQCLKFKSEGNGGMPEFIQNLPAAELAWGAFKVVGVDNRGNTVSRRPKFVFVKYFPQEAPSIKRARAGAHKGPLKQIIDAHIDIEVCAYSIFNIFFNSFLCFLNLLQIENKADLTEEAIIQKLRSCGGAHQPTGYEFSNFSK